METLVAGICIATIYYGLGIVFIIILGAVMQIIGSRK